MEAFRQELRDLGYVEGQNLIIEWRWAEGREERLPDLAAELVRLQVEVSADELDTAFAAMTREGADALIVLSDPAQVDDLRGQIADLAAKSRLPAMYPWKMFVEAGGLMAYAPSLLDMYRRAAVFVDKILKGTKPADLPIELPHKLNLFLNLKTAETLGITLPPALLRLADEVIK